jgi:transcriptional regulator with XRE-family HTH domain
MATAKPFDAKTRKKVSAFVADPLDARKTEGINQSEFWSRFGVTQSGGSRYENGRNIPGPTQILLALYAAGKITQDDLSAAQQAIGPTFRASAD